MADEEILARMRKRFESELDEYMDEWEESLRKHMVEKHSEKFCQEGVNKGKPGVCPESRPGKPSTPRADKKAKKAWNKAFTSTRAGMAMKAGKEAAARVGQAAWSKLGPKTQRSLAVIGWVGKKAWGFVEAPLHAMQHGIKTGALALAKARGLDEAQVAKVATVLAVADAIPAWTGANSYGVHFAIHALELLGGPPAFIAAKVGFYVPVASLAYIMHSGAMLAATGTIRAARKAVAMLKGKHAEEFAEGDLARQVRFGRLLDAFRAHDFDPWYEALVYAALDEAGGDVAKAVKLADAAYHQQPKQQSGKP